MREHRPVWTHWYRLYVDGKRTDMALCGTSKHDAYKLLEREWGIAYPGEPVPPKRRCRLEREESVREG